MEESSKQRLEYLYKEYARLSGKAFVASYRLTFGSFLLAIAFAAIVLPFVVLCYSNIFYAVIYLLLAVSSFFYVQVFRRMVKQYSRTKFL